MTTIPPSFAANAYQRLATLTDPMQGGAGGGAASPLEQKGGGNNFGSMLTDIVGGVQEAGHTADVRASQVAQGKGDLVDVVTAVAESEVALETLVSVRDRVIAAYEEIMRMPI